METTKIVIGTAILLLVASTPFFVWRLGRKHGWRQMARRRGQPRYSRQRHRAAEQERGIPFRMIEESTVVRAVRPSSR